MTGYGQREQAGVEMGKGGSSACCLSAIVLYNYDTTTLVVNHFQTVTTLIRVQ